MSTQAFNRDCMEAMREFPNRFFDLAISDTEYGIGESRKQGVGKRNDFIVDGRNGKVTPVKTYHIAKSWDDRQPEQSYFDELFRVSKKHIIFGENYILFDQKDQSSGRIFWDKVNGDNDFSDGELIWTDIFSSVRQIEFMWNGMMQGKSLSEGRIQNGDKRNQARIHPTQKPVLLYKWLLQNYANSGSKILDTHLGSGSSRIAAHDMGFEFWGYELDKDYFEAQEKRFKQHISQLTLTF